MADQKSQPKWRDPRYMTLDEIRYEHHTLTSTQLLSEMRLHVDISPLDVINRVEELKTAWETTMEATKAAPAAPERDFTDAIYPTPPMQVGIKGPMKITVTKPISERPKAIRTKEKTFPLHVIGMIRDETSTRLYKQKGGKISEYTADGLEGAFTGLIVIIEHAYAPDNYDRLYEMDAARFLVDYWYAIGLTDKRHNPGEILAEYKPGGIIDG